MKKTRQVKFRAFEKTDAVRLHEAFNNPRLMRVLSAGNVLPFSRERAQAFVDLNIADKDLCYNFAVEDERGLLIGNCGYMDVSHKNRTCRIFVSIYDPALWGKGYGTAALLRLLDFLFMEKNMRKVQLSVFSFNERGIACYEKLGFRKEARLSGQVFRDGKYHDEVCMAIFDRDYGAALAGGRK